MTRVSNAVAIVWCVVSRTHSEGFRYRFATCLCWKKLVKPTLLYAKCGSSPMTMMSYSRRFTSYFMSFSLRPQVQCMPRVRAEPVYSHKGNADHAQTHNDDSFPLCVDGYFVGILQLLDCLRKPVGLRVIPLAVAHIDSYG